MRQFKFRVWDLALKKFITYNPLCMSFDSKEYVFQQFTGILDVDGKEIYEGDAVLTCWLSWDKKPSIVCYWYGKYVACIAWIYKKYNGDIPQSSSGNCWYSCLLSEAFTSSPRTQFKVVGNVFENPELLNECSD